MPRGDGTGPAGLGPMTGRAAGYCAGYPVPGYMNPVPGGGFWGWGRGTGWRRWGYVPAAIGWARPPVWPQAAYGMVPAWGAYGAPYAAPFAPGATKEQYADMLKNQAEYLKSMLDEVNEQIKELEEEDEED